MAGSMHDKFLDPQRGGRYDAVAAKLMADLHAEGILLIVVKGIHGDGCTVKIDANDMNRKRVAGVCRQIAANLINDAAKARCSRRMKTESITCPLCGWTSYNPNDIAHRYCGHCHIFHDDHRSAVALALAFSAAAASDFSRSGNPLSAPAIAPDGTSNTSASSTS